MAGITDPATSVTDFVKHETRQVWVRDLATGSARYLQNGEHDREDRQAFTQTFGCVIPECDEPIGIRGGTHTRTHYWHLRASTHDNESADHYAAKMMMRAWLLQRADVTFVEEEFTVKTESVDRRPDVYARGHDWQGAYEVEYKAYDPVEWARKHTELTSLGITTTWLIGHSRLRAGTGDDAGRVHLSPLARAITKKGLPLLAINPHTRTVATLCSTVNPHEPPPWWSSTARIVIEPLDACSLGPDGSLLTPHLIRIREAAERRRERERRQRERAEKKQRNRERRNVTDRARDSENHAQKWLRSREKQRVFDLFGALPSQINTSLRHDHVINASPEHWHTFVYLAFIHDQVGKTFSIETVIQAMTGRFRGANLSTNYDRFMAVHGLLMLWEHANLVWYARGKENGWLFTVRADVNTVDAMMERYAENARKTQLYDQVVEFRDRMSREQATLADRTARARVSRREQERREVIVWTWHKDRDYRTLASLGEGRIPAAVSWPGENVQAWVTFPLTPPEKWRARVWACHVLTAREGDRVTCADALASLAQKSIFPVDRDAGGRAISGYLHNLAARGLLVQVGPDRWRRTTMSALPARTVCA